MKPYRQSNNHHLSKFSSVHADMADYATGIDLTRDLDVVPDGAESMRRIAYLLAFCLKNGARFYLPLAADILDGKVIDEEVKELTRLPYDCVCVLSEQRIGDDAEHMRLDGYGVTVAFDPASVFAKSGGLMSQAMLDSLRIGERGFMVFSAVKTTGRNRWLPMPCLGYCDLGIPGNGYAFRAAMPTGLPQSTISPSDECRDDVGNILNLCVMLSLHNVTASQIEAPERLNRKRIKNNKLPLFSYHVLQVDGELWDSANSDGDPDSLGIRSHLRRGHIRRLQDPERKVWVRPTMVHGKRPGFVHKDYEVATSTGMQ